MSRGCVIFDFDGVIADTESLHHAVYNATFAAHAADIGGPLEIPRAAYFSRYIVYGDREGFFHMLRDAGRPTEPALIDRLAAAKHELFTEKLSSFAEPLPGVRDTLAWLERRNVPRAICSGARRGEIVDLLDAFGLRHHFDVLVTIEDVTQGKPDPQGYNLCFDKLNLEYDAELEKDYSLVIEDSAGGCAAAMGAGLRVLGVATSLPVEELKKCSTYAVESLDMLDKDTLATWLGVKDWGGS
jgi:beta-phosphoglucomutase